MNFRRGLTRLFVVLATCYYAVGGLLVFWDWQNQRDRLSVCLAAVKSPKPDSENKSNPLAAGESASDSPKVYTDISGNPVVVRDGLMAAKGGPSGLGTEVKRDLGTQAAHSPQVVEFEGAVHTFPPDASQGFIARALKQFHDGNCLKDYPPKHEWAVTFAFLLFPALAYAVWKVISWVARGFLHDPPSPVGG